MSIDLKLHRVVVFITFIIFSVCLFLPILTFAEDTLTLEADKNREEWQQKATHDGDADAQYNLGKMYLEGNGVPQDDSEAAKWFRKAAEQGNSKAQKVLGGP